MFSEAAFMQHTVSIAAYRKDTASFHGVMIVQCESFLRMFNAALIDHRLAIIFTGGLQPVDAKQAIGSGMKDGGRKQVF